MAREAGTTVLVPENYPKEIRHLIEICKGPCKRVTRPSSVKKWQAPDTVTRQASSMCQQCLTLTGGVVMDDAEMDEMVQKRDRHNRETLAKFMAKRNERLARRRGAA